VDETWLSLLQAEWRAVSCDVTTVNDVWWILSARLRSVFRVTDRASTRVAAVQFVAATAGRTNLTANWSERLVGEASSLMQVMLADVLLVTTGYEPKLHYFDLLWICRTASDQHNKRGDASDVGTTRRRDASPRLLRWSQVRRHVKMLWIIHDFLYNLLYNKSTTNRSNGVCAVYNALVFTFEFSRMTVGLGSRVTTFLFV